MSNEPNGKSLDEMTGSEAVYGLLGWLTTQPNPVTFSSCHNAALAADLAKRFCETNGLRDVRDDWADRLTHPVDDARHTKDYYRDDPGDNTYNIAKDVVPNGKR